MNEQHGSEHGHGQHGGHAPEQAAARQPQAAAAMSFSSVSVSTNSPRLRRAEL